MDSPSDRLRGNLRRLLDERGMTPADLARALGRTQGWVSLILSGERTTTFATLQELASALHCDISGFLQPLAKSPTLVSTSAGSLVDSTPPHHLEGGPAYGDSARALVQENQRLRQELAIVREGFAVFSEKLGGFPDRLPAKRARRTPKKKPRPL